MKRQPPSRFEARTLFSVLTPEYIPISTFPLIQTACSIVWIWQAIWHECEAVVLLGCLLATKTEAKEPRPMGSSFSNSSFQENNGKLSPKTDGNGLGFDFSKEGSLKAMLSLGLQVISACKHLWNLASVCPLVGGAQPFRACENSIEIDSTRIISRITPHQLSHYLYEYFFKNCW